MPLTDEIFVKDIYNELVSEGLIEEPAKSFFGAMLPTTNVKNAVIFVKGKYGVGPVALGITNSATNQADTLSISQNYVNQDNVARPTKLLFEGLEETYTLDNYTDNKGTVISEILSQLLTTQVDCVKNPTAVLMKINMQTLGVMLYLIRRKVNPKSVILLLQQPLIKQYLIAQRQNESLFNKNADSVSNAKGNRKAELSKKDLIAKLLRENGYSETELVDPYLDFSINDSKMLISAKSKKFDQDQLMYLSYFVDELQPQARAFSDFQQTQNSDTKGLKDKQMLDESDVIYGRTQLSGIIASWDVSRLDNTGVISPFYQFGRKSYRIYDRFYSLLSSPFAGVLTDFKNKAAAIAPSASKDRVRQTIENDFILFLVHNYILTKDEFNRLMKGDETTKSVALRVKDLKLVLPSNLVLKAFFPMLSNSIDQLDNKRVDNLRLFEKELNSLDNNDLRLSLEEIAETDLDLYTDIVKLLMFQTGLNISPFNYRSVIPVGLDQNRTEYNEYQYLYADILRNAVKTMESKVKNQKEAELIFKDFQTLFAANNPQFLRKNFYHPLYPYPLAKSWDRKTQMFTLHPNDGKGLPNTNITQPTLGNAYMKQYFLSGKITNSKNPNVEKEALNKTFEQTVFNEETEVTTNSPQPEVKSSIVKNNWTKDSPKESPNTAYIFTENINSIGSSRVGGGSAVIRNNPNAIGIVTKKYYVYAEDRATSKVTGGWNQDFQNTEADFELFKKVNLEQFTKIDKYETKIFPQGFASDLAKIPTRFAEWLQNELLSRYGLVTELNSTKTGLISKSVTSVTQSTVKKSINIYAGTNENAELSNFAIRPFKFIVQPIVSAIYGEKLFDSVEQAFQWHKGLFAEAPAQFGGSGSKTVSLMRQIKETKNGAEIKKLGQQFNLIKSKQWDSFSSVLMKDLLKASFEQNPKDLEKLLATGNAELTHTQDKGKWGKEFPKLLMEVRDELRPKTVENLEDYQVVWSSEDTPKSSNPPSSSDEFFPTEFRSQINLGADSINSAKTESFEKEIGIRNSDGTRKKMKESDYETALRKVKRLNSKYPSMFELIKTTGEKGDGRVYYSIKLSPYGLRKVNLGYKPDLNMRDKYFENGSKTDVKTILKKISESDSNLVTVAKQLLKYASINNVSIELVKEIEDPSFSDNDVSVTNGIFYNKRSPIHPNTILISEFANFTNGRAEGVIIHEILHALTYEELFHKNKDAAKDFEKLFEYVKANSPKGMYALTNLDEFMTGIFTNARFIQHLKTLPPTKSVKEYKNLFEEILDLFRKLFNLQDDSALTQAMSIASHVLMDVRTEKDYKDSFESLQEFDKSKSQYSPSLKLYEGFINLNQLYQGDEILPFIGESEYYRYLVPMLLNMNPKAQTMFTDNLNKAAVAEGIRQDLPIDYLLDVSNLSLKRSVRGASFNTMNTNFIKNVAKTKTLVHELVHLTLQKEYEKNGDFKQKIDELWSYSDDRAKSDSYGFTSPKEFLAEALSNPDFMQELNEIQYKEETIWSYLMTLVSDFINNLLNVELKSDSVLAEVVRLSEQVLNNNVKEMSKDKPIEISSVKSEILDNWDNYFPRYSWMNDTQKQMTAKLVEEGKINLTCKI